MKLHKYILDTKGEALRITARRHFADRRDRIGGIKRKMKMYRFEAYAVTDKGRIRLTNQDTYFLHGGIVGEPTAGCEQKTGCASFGVFDGMGGESCGAEAAAAAAKAFAEMDAAAQSAERRRATPSGEQLGGFYAAAHAAVGEIQRREKATSGTTAATLTLRSDGVWISNIGDSRVFQISKGTIRQLSEDHTLNELMIRSGAMTREQAERSMGKGRLLRFVGAPPEECDTAPHIAGPIKVRGGDVFVLCSDGVTDALGQDAILARCGAKGTCEQMAKALVFGAIEGGSKDNCTALIVRIL